MPETTNYELYEQAAGQLAESFDMLDQARATLLDLGFTRGYELESSGPYRQNTSQVARHLEKLIESLKNADCPDCDDPMAKHGEYGGCQGVTIHPDDPAERAVLCGCDWGQRKAGGGRLPVRATLSSPGHDTNTDAMHSQHTNAHTNAQREGIYG